MGGRGLFDGILIIGPAVDVYFGLSDGSLKACLAAVLDQCRERFAKVEEREEVKMRGREQG